MKLKYQIRSITLTVSSFTDSKTYHLTGDRWGHKLEIALSQPEWDALFEACGHPINVGNTIEIEIPGELPDEDECLEDEEEVSH